jgi:hypothetical protein
MQKSNRTNRLAFLMVLLALVMLAAPAGSHAGSFTFTVLEDSFVYSGLPNNNFGFDSSLIASLSIFNSYLNFDISSIPNTEIITGGIINLYNNTTPSSTWTIDLFSASSTWTETGITWNNQPGFVSLITSFSTTPGWSQASLPASSLSTPVFSLGLTGQTTSVVYFKSKQSSFQPYLTVETTTAPVPLPGGALLLGGGLLRLYASRRRRQD